MAAARIRLADDSNDWFPHISPDGKWMVFLAYNKSMSGHPPTRRLNCA